MKKTSIKVMTTKICKVNRLETWNKHGLVIKYLWGNQADSSELLTWKVCDGTWLCPVFEFEEICRFKQKKKKKTRVSL